MHFLPSLFLVAPSLFRVQRLWTKGFKVSLLRERQRIKERKREGEREGEGERERKREREGVREKGREGGREFRIYRREMIYHIYFCYWIFFLHHGHLSYEFLC